MDEKYVIIDVHPSDSFYDDKNELLGLVLVPGENWHNSVIENDTLLDDMKYMAGGATLEHKLGLLNNGNFVYFYAVMVAPLSEIENS